MNRIIWKKWVDPFLAAVREHKDRGWVPDYDYVERAGQVGVFQGPCVFGGPGIVPLNELNCPSRQFNLWVGHSSFEITPSVRDRMMAAPGVEVLKVWTRYRFWLGVAPAFEEGEVKRGVLAAALPRREWPAAAPPAEATRGAEALADLLRSRHRHWAVFEMPDGKLEVSCGEDRGQVEEDVRSRAGSARRVLTSWGGGERC